MLTWQNKLMPNIVGLLGRFQQNHRPHLMGISPAGGLDEGGWPDNPEPPHSTGDTQCQDRHHIRPQQLEPAHPPGQGDGQGLLHVPDKHQHHEETSRLCRRPQ